MSHIECVDCRMITSVESHIVMRCSELNTYEERKLQLCDNCYTIISEAVSLKTVSSCMASLKTTLCTNVFSYQTTLLIYMNQHFGCLQFIKWSSIALFSTLLSSWNHYHNLSWLNWPSSGMIEPAIVPECTTMESFCAFVVHLLADLWVLHI